jgi:hypothetical protein
MSAKILSAVMRSGPEDVRLRLALCGIADSGDDFGFAELAIDTIALNAVCDARTVKRVVERLQQDGWMRVGPSVDGKSVYMVNLVKLGISDDVKGKSDWHLACEDEAERSVAQV